MRVVFSLLILFIFPLYLFAYFDELVAVVGERPVTKSLVESVQHVFGFENFEQALSFVIDSYIVLNYMEKNGYSISDRELEAYIVHSGIYDIKEELRKVGMSYDEYLDFIRAKRFADQIFAELVGGSFITEQEMKKFYDQNEADIRSRFEKRFVYYKEDVTVPVADLKDMKEIGWVKRSELKKDFEEVIFSLPSTGFTTPIYSDGKWIIFFVSKIKKPDFRELKDDPDFREFYIKSKYKEVFDLWVENQKRKQRVLRK